MNTVLFNSLKRILFLLVVAVLVVGIVAAQLKDTEAADNSIVRIKLSIESTTSFSFALNGNYCISGKPEINLASGSYTVKLQSGSLNLYSGSKLLCSGSTIRIAELLPSPGSYNYASIKTTKYGTNNYRGDIEFRISGSSIVAINHIYLEYYVYGVVPHEMSNSWPIEALKAQAVTARTYAVRNMGGGTYDMGDTSSHQVYKGFNPSYTNAIKAVDDTSKQVLKSGSEYVQTYYAASNGGYVDIPQHVWSASAALKPYHVLKEDPYDTANAWSVQEVLIFPKNMSGSGGVRYEYMKDGAMIPGSSSLSDNALRYFKVSALPAVAAQGYIAAVSSDIEVLEIGRITAHTYAGNHGLPDYTGENSCVVFNKADVTMTVLASRNATMEEELETGNALVSEPVTVTFTIDLNKLDEVGGTYRAFNNSSLRIFVVEEKETSWNIYHRRYGHGVGLSQRGAQTQARQGRTYQQILEFYYPNTSLEQLNIAPPVLNPPAPVDNEYANATIINCVNYVNVRSTPSTTYAAIGKAFAGSRITVTEQYVTPEWHKIDFGGIDAYIFAYYVQIDEPVASEPPAEPPTEPPAPSESPAPTETPVTSDPPTQSPLPSPTNSPQKPAISQTGTVLSTTLNVRSGPGTSFSIVGSIIKGDIVEIIKAYDTAQWHKIWYNNRECHVFAEYVKLENEIKATGVVTASVLNVRSGAGTSFSAIGSLQKGAPVDIITLNASSAWYKILFNGDVGYIHADYVKVQGQEGGDNSGNSGGSDAPAVLATVNANRVNFRQTADLNGRILKTLSRGDTVQIINLGSKWHNVKHGGVEGYMYAEYLDVSSAVYGTVTAGTLNVRSSASTSSTILGKLSKGAVVEIIKKGATWHTIKYKTYIAYVYASYIKLQ